MPRGPGRFWSSWWKATWGRREWLEMQFRLRASTVHLSIDSISKFAPLDKKLDKKRIKLNTRR